MYMNAIDIHISWMGLHTHKSTVKLVCTETNMQTHGVIEVFKEDSIQ